MTESDVARAAGAGHDRPASERPNPASRDLDRGSALDIVRLMNAEDATVAGAVAGELPAIAEAIERIAERLRGGGRLIYIGAGTSGRLAALDAVECPPTFNVSPDTIVARIAGGDFAWNTAVEDAEDRADLGAVDLRELNASAADAVVCVTASGSTPYALGAASYARERGALTIGLTCNTHTPLHELADLTIAPVVGPEVIAGSTRLKAGTAQKMVLNMLSTGVMALLGKIYGNLMVDVVPSNTKLRRRARDIVCAIAEVDAPAAEALLRDCGGEVKTAVVVSRTSLSPEQARARLARHDGALRAALESEA